VTDTVPPPPVVARPGQAYEAARLRWASIADAPRLALLWRVAYPDDAVSAAEMTAWLEHGGALTLQDGTGRILAAMRWREEGSGWRVDRVATRPEERGQGYGRWLATKVEALAIRQNVPHLLLVLPCDDDGQVAYYRRLGYQVVADAAESSGRTLRKVVGGTWQTKAPTAANA
jgi:ribosomal protein S18 acetylase RimI-like enzyme